MGGVLIVGIATTKLFIRLTRNPALPILSLINVLTCRPVVFALNKA
jgi:hypothetical protein